MVVITTESCSCLHFKTKVRTFGHLAVNRTTATEFTGQRCFQHSSTMRCDEPEVVTGNSASPSGCSLGVPDGMPGDNINPQTRERITPLNDDHGSR
jgi:hypothetical protein